MSLDVVAKKALLNQTALLASTTIFTSTDGGDFFVSIYSEGNSASVAAGIAAVNLFWTDELQSTSTGNNVGQWTSINKISYGAVFVVRMAPNSSLAISVTGTAPPAGSSYSLHCTVAELTGPRY
jgi:hypothetical protein